MWPGWAASDLAATRGGQIVMGDSNALGFMGVMFGLLGVIIMVYGMARGLGLSSSAQMSQADGAFTWSLITWAIGLGLVIADRYTGPRGP